jgi:hypothetical protein
LVAWLSQEGHGFVGTRWNMDVFCFTVLVFSFPMTRTVTWSYVDWNLRRHQTKIGIPNRGGRLPVDFLCGGCWTEKMSLIRAGQCRCITLIKHIFICNIHTFVGRPMVRVSSRHCHYTSDNQKRTKWPLHLTQALSTRRVIHVRYCDKVPNG